MSEADTTRATANQTAPARKPRSKVERAIVWGVIAIGAGLVLTEGLSRLRYSLDFQALEEAVAAQDATDRGVVESQAKELMTSYSSYESQSGLRSNELASPRVDTYKYKGLLSERAIYVYYGHTRAGEEPEVLAVLREPVAFVEATAPTDELQPQALDLTPVDSAANPDAASVEPDAPQ